MTQNKEVMCALDPASFRPQLDCAHFWAADILEWTKNRVIEWKKLIPFTFQVVESLRLLKKENAVGIEGLMFGSGWFFFFKRKKNLFRI